MTELNQPNVSIILPFYNAEKTLYRAIKSIQDQSYSNFECILIDNGSDDNGVGIVHEVTRLDPRFILINESKQGVTFASNAGARIAKGKYIARMDSDDYSLPDRISLQVEYLDNNHNFGAVSGKVEHISEKENTDGFARYVDWVNSVLTYEDILKNQFIESPIVNPTAMWRKETADEYGLYRNGDFPEDYEMWLRWLSRGVKMAKLDEILLKWYDSSTRLTRTHPIYSNEAFFKVKSKYLVLWLRRNNPLFPKVAIWGASRISRKYIGFLENEGIEVDYYIDIKESRQLESDIKFYKDIPSPQKAFVLVYMKHKGIKSKIQEYLELRKYREGVHYLVVS